MTFFFETLLGGLLAGTMYSLVAIGFVLIYKASGVFNFAQGSMLLFAALTFVSLHDQGVPFALALLLSVVVMIIGALLIERLVLRPLVNRSQITLFMATLGLSFIIEGLAQGLMGSQVRALDLGIDDVPIFIGGLMVSQFDLIAAAAAIVLVTVLALLFNKTRIGVSLRAVADDTTAALSIGINLNRIWQIVWAVAGVVGLVAGLLWGARQGVQFSLSLVVLRVYGSRRFRDLRFSAAFAGTWFAGSTARWRIDQRRSGFRLRSAEFADKRLLPDGHHAGGAILP